MPRSESRTKVGIWNADEDFRLLTKDAQRAYWMLYTQAEITLCGVVPFTPTKWQRYAADESEAELHSALTELEAARYIVIDTVTVELFVRSFMRNDGVKPAAPKVWNPAMEQASWVQSSRIREALSVEIARLNDGHVPEFLEKYLVDTVFPVEESDPVEGIQNNESEAGIGPVHACASPAPTPSPSPSPTPLGDSATAASPDRRSRAPEQLEITPEMREWAKAHGLGAVDLERQTEQMLDHHRSKGSKMLDWKAAWRTWLGRIPQFQPDLVASKSGPARLAPPPKNPCPECVGSGWVDASDGSVAPCPTCAGSGRAA